ncbi:hypothetical protein N7457_007789 [Penicillium paradoxum]|uniref:uncharacterized protein n=1 Tax=Penicillium paradoxum TaxID=176176 RepID=UPI002549B6DC|nr:uncharacterized protein N7457_007789 [Penicillium paradoxum]KAJ5772893.1 hypothetical protein N7457_007789 [Penicillium paradoxum]
MANEDPISHYGVFISRTNESSPLALRKKRNFYKAALSLDWLVPSESQIPGIGDSSKYRIEIPVILELEN